jgi:hypothetical protein
MHSKLACRGKAMMAIHHGSRPAFDADGHRPDSGAEDQGCHHIHMLRVGFLRCPKVEYGA